MFSNNKKSFPDPEIPVWVDGRKKWVTGINKRSTFDDIVFALLRHQLACAPYVTQDLNQPEDDNRCRPPIASISDQNIHNLLPQYCIVEVRDKVERPIKGSAKVMKVWRAWSSSGARIALLLRRIEQTKRGSPFVGIASHTAARSTPLAQVLTHYSPNNSHLNTTTPENIGSASPTTPSFFQRLLFRKSSSSSASNSDCNTNHQQRIQQCPIQTQHHINNCVKLSTDGAVAATQSPAPSSSTTDNCFCQQIENFSTAIDLPQNPNSFQENGNISQHLSTLNAPVDGLLKKHQILKNQLRRIDNLNAMISQLESTSNQYPFHRRSSLGESNESNEIFDDTDALASFFPSVQLDKLTNLSKIYQQLNDTLNRCKERSDQLEGVLGKDIHSFQCQMNCSPKDREFHALSLHPGHEFPTQNNEMSIDSQNKSPGSAGIWDDVYASRELTRVQCKEIHDLELSMRDLEKSLEAKRTNLNQLESLLLSKVLDDHLTIESSTQNCSLDCFDNQGKLNNVSALRGGLDQAQHKLPNGRLNVFEQYAEGSSTPRIPLIGGSLCAVRNAVPNSDSQWTHLHSNGQRNDTHILESLPQVSRNVLKPKCSEVEKNQNHLSCLAHMTLSNPLGDTDSGINSMTSDENAIGATSLLNNNNNRLNQPTKSIYRVENTLIKRATSNTLTMDNVRLLQLNDNDHDQTRNTLETLV